MTRSKKIQSAVATICVAVLASTGLAACGSSKSSTASPATTAGSKANNVTNTSKPVVSVPEGAPPTELKTTDITVGTGKEAVAGSTVSVQYVGVSYSTKKEFDASWDRGQPFSFKLGAGKVIKGWDQGVAGMKEGGRRELIIPPDLGYGASGAGSDIGPNETLVFVVDLISVS